MMELDTEIEDTSPVAEPCVTSPMGIWLWLLRLALCIAAGLALFLASLSFSQAGLPPGCGDGSGCADVLTSRWSTVLGLPVSLPAAVVYLAMLASTVWISRATSHASARWAWVVLIGLSFVVCFSAAWFIVVQYFVINAVCTYCMVDHLTGLFSAGLVFWRMPRVQVVDSADGLPISRNKLAMSALVLVVVFASLQWMRPSPGSPVIRLPSEQNADSGPGPGRQITALEGALRFVVDDEPVIGPVTADKMLVLMFDYCCPHCRRTHSYLLDSLDRYPGQLCIVALPMPLNSNCNPNWPKTGSRFKNSCDLARLALAVAQVDPPSFAEFDRWLFESDAPREVQESRDVAEQLVGPVELQRALSDESVTEKILRNVTAYGASGADRIPVVASPDFSTVVGRPSSADELYGILETELGLVPQFQSSPSTNGDH